MAKLPPRPDLSPTALSPVTTGRGRPWGLLIAAAGVVGGLVGSLATVGGLAAIGVFDRSDAEVVQQAAPVTTTTVATVFSATTAAQPSTGWSPETIAAETGPALYRLEVNRPQGRTTGTAVAVQTGYVATSKDLVESATELWLTDEDGRKTRAELVGDDQWTNVAVLRLARPARTPSWGNSSALAAGASVVIVGAPEDAASTSPSVYGGVVNSLQVRHTLDSGMVLHDLIRTDANLLSGSRGSVVADQATGAIVAMVTTIGREDTGVERIGLATPIETVRASAEALIRTNGRPDDAWLGIRGESLTPEAAEPYGLKGGVTVVEVLQPSPAVQAGLAPGDVIAKVNGTPVLGMSPLVMALRSVGPGKSAVLTFFRPGIAEEQSVYVFLQFPPLDWPLDVR
jgi:serine protease DegQ